MQYFDASMARLCCGCYVTSVVQTRSALLHKEILYPIGLIMKLLADLILLCCFIFHISIHDGENRTHIYFVCSSHIIHHFDGRNFLQCIKSQAELAGFLCNYIQHLTTITDFHAISCIRTYTLLHWCIYIKIQ